MVFYFGYIENRLILLASILYVFIIIFLTQIGFIQIPFNSGVCANAFDFAFDCMIVRKQETIY